MSEIIFFYFIAYIVLGLASVSLGILVFVNNKKKVNLIFFLFSLAIALWAFLQAFWMTIDNYDEALFFGRLMVVPVIFIPVLYFHWVLIFLQKKATKRLIVAYTMTGIFVLFSFNDAFISELAQVGPYKYFPQSNWLHKLFLVEWLFLVSCGVFRLFEAYKKATSNKRRQIKMVLIGTLIGFIGGTCNFLFMFGIGFVPPIASLLIFVFLIMMGYAMVEYNLMNVEAVFVKLLLVILNVAAISFIFVSNSTSEYIYKIVFASFIVFVSVLLGKSYQKEIKQKKELLKVSKDLKRANVGLKQLDKSKSEFITIASNQLKTPITVIKGYTSLIAEGVYNDDKEKISSALKKVFAANENLEQLANDLLDVARIESGELEYHWEDVSIEKVLDKVRRVFLTHAQDKKLEFKVVKSEKKLPLIRADELKFYQSVASLVDNAIKYTQKGFVRVSTEVDKKNVRIIVEDSGVGISKESLETLFLKFSRGVDNSRLYTEGAGFGLYISKSLVELQGGKVYAESEGIGKGSRFIVEMPIHKCV